MEEQIALLEQAIAELQQKVAQFDAIAFAEEVRYELVLWQEKTAGLIRNLEVQTLDTIKRIDGLDELIKKADDLLKKIEGVDPEKTKQAVLEALSDWRNQSDKRLDAVEAHIAQLEQEIKKISPKKILELVQESIQEWKTKVEVDLSENKTNLDKLSVDLAALKIQLDTAINDLKSQIEQLHATDKTHDDQFLKLDADLVALAKRMEEIAQQGIDPALIQGEVEKLIKAWKIKIEKRLTDLEALSSAIDTLKKRIDEFPPILSVDDTKQLIAVELSVFQVNIDQSISAISTELALKIEQVKNALSADLAGLHIRLLQVEDQLKNGGNVDTPKIIVLVIKELETWQKQIEQRITVLEAQRVVDRQDIDKLLQGLLELSTKVGAMVILTQTDVTNLINANLAPWISKIESIEQLMLTLQTRSNANQQEIAILKAGLDALVQTLAGPLPANWEVQVQQMIEALLVSIKADLTQHKLDKTTLEAALALLKTTVAGLQNDLTALTETVSNLPVPLTEAEINALIGTQIGVLQTDLEAQIIALELRISALEAGQAGILVVIQEIKAGISTHSTKIDLIQHLVTEVKSTVESLPPIPSQDEIVAIVNDTISAWKLEITAKIEQLQACCAEGQAHITEIEHEIVEIKKELQHSDASGIGIRLARRCLTGWGIVSGLEIKSDDTCSLQLSKGSGITPRGVLLHACEPLYFTHYRVFEKPANDPIFKNYECWELLVWETLGIAPGDPIPEDIHPLTPQTGLGSETPMIADKAVILLPGEQQNHYLLIRIEDLVALSGKTADLQHCMGKDDFDPDLGFSETFSPLDALPTDNDLYLAFNPVMLLAEIPLFRFGFRPPDECDPEDLDSPNFPVICGLDQMYDTWLPIIEDAFKQVDRWVKTVMEQYHELLFPQLDKDIFTGKLNLLFEKWTAFTQYNKHALPEKNRKFFVQYFYDWARDLIAGYHELRSELQILMAELCLCRPDLLLEQRPWLMLGVAVRPDQDGLAAPLRDAFHQSPIFNGNFVRLETCRLYYRREFEMIEGFYLPGYQDDLTLPCWCNQNDDGWEPDFSRLKITPGKGYIHALSRQSLPFYYPLAPNMESLHFYWEYRRAKMRQLDYHLSYHASDADDSYSHRPEVIRPLYYSLDPHDFYRVEGFVGETLVPLSSTLSASPAEALRFMVRKYNLDFDVVELDIYCNECRFLSQKYKVPNTTVDAFVNSFRQDLLGAEHLAGVPKGGTFIVVITENEDNKKVAIADFALPYRCCPEKPKVCQYEAVIKKIRSCNDGNVPVEFIVTALDAMGGIHLYLDGEPYPIGFPESYKPDPTGITQMQVIIPGDGKEHTIGVQDTEEPCCKTIVKVTVPKCTCKMTVSAEKVGIDPAGFIRVRVTVNTDHPVSGEFSVLFDGKPTIPKDVIKYTGAETKFEFKVHPAVLDVFYVISVKDVKSDLCSAETSINLF